MEDAHGIQRRDTINGPPLRILSLDGGGVRGFSIFIVLQELMYRTYVETYGTAPRRDQIPKPCDMFDLIVGTGTGGLIAIMLGRLRMDLETCKDVYINTTKRVFVTDKTFAGVPLHSTMFKASRLEEAICDCVREHTVSRKEGNDGTPANDQSAPNRQPTSSRESGLQRRLSRNSFTNLAWAHKSSGHESKSSGNPYAALYDARETRTKTAVTAVYKGTPKNGKPVLLRSYDSRREPPPDFNCTIWQAGRATCASALAFKPVKIGQYSFLDEGVMNYNPSPEALDEALLNEWPGREIGVFVSVGTGKRSKFSEKVPQHEWWEGIVGAGLSQFAEARRRLVTKIDGCEKTHEYMLNEHLRKRGVPVQNYFRLNVEVGVGGFKMNEWNRLGEISTSTRMYLATPPVQEVTLNASRKLSRLWVAHGQISTRHSVVDFGRSPSVLSYQDYYDNEHNGETSSFSPLPCCPEDAEVSQSPPASPDLHTASQHASPVQEELGSPYRQLRRKQRYQPSNVSPRFASPGRSSSSGEAIGVAHPSHQSQRRGSQVDSGISTDSPSTIILPCVGTPVPGAWSNQVQTKGAHVDSGIGNEWSSSDIPQPLNVEHKSSGGSTHTTTPPTTAGDNSGNAAADGQSTHKYGELGVDQRNPAVHHDTRRGGAATASSSRRPSQRSRNSQQSYDRRRSPPARETPSQQSRTRMPQHAARHSMPVNQPSEFAQNEYTSIIPPYPVDEDDSIIPIPEANSSKSTSRPSTGAITHDSVHPPPSLHVTIPRSPSPAVAIPVPPPRAASRLWASNVPSPRTSSENEERRYKRQTVSGIPNHSTSELPANEPSAARVGNLESNKPEPPVEQKARPRTASNDSNDFDMPSSSVAAVVDGDVGRSRNTRPASSDASSPIREHGGGANPLPYPTDSSAWEPSLGQPPSVRRETKPTYVRNGVTNP